MDIMGDKLKKLYEIEEIAKEIIKSGKVSWIEAIEIAKEKVVKKKAKDKN